MNVNFTTKNIPNAFISARLRNHKTFIINKYFIRGHKFDGETNNRLQTWKLEGKNRNGKWIELDKHENEPIQKLQVTMFSISCNTRLKEVRLTQTGINTHDTNHLVINALKTTIYVSKYQKWPKYTHINKVAFSF